MDNPIDVKAVFQDALKQTISNYSDQARIEISMFIMHVCAQVRPYMLVTEAGAETMSDEVFLNDIRRDFVINLLFNFCPRLSFTNNVNAEFKKLISALTFSLSISDKTDQSGTTNQRYNDKSKLPTEIQTRLPTYDNIQALLDANKWLVMILLMALYISVEDFEPPKS